MRPVPAAERRSLREPTGGSRRASLSPPGHDARGGLARSRRQQPAESTAPPSRNQDPSTGTSASAHARDGRTMLAATTPATTATIDHSSVPNVSSPKSSSPRCDSHQTLGGSKNTQKPVA